MKIKFDDNFLYLINDQVRYIARDKPFAVKKFKVDLIQHLKKDLQFPYNFKKSIYFEDESIRDYVFKGYTIVYRIHNEQEIVEIFEFIKYMESL
jgi:mRNA-degrading endonuclease RelE of RelBE toxin-antitoxin system